jgi:hypothetical protein
MTQILLVIRERRDIWIGLQSVVRRTGKTAQAPVRGPWQDVSGSIVVRIFASISVSLLPVA